MNETDKIKEWLENATVIHKLEDGDLIIIKVDEPSVQAHRSLWKMFSNALKEVNDATKKNVTVLFLTPGWEVEAVPRTRTKAKLLEMLRLMDDAMEICRSCSKEYPKRDKKCPACGMKVRT